MAPITGPLAPLPTPVLNPPSSNPENRVSLREEDSMNNEPSQSGKPIVGIIYPPLEIRNIVDKTAAFVARNGLEFENRIKQNEAQNPKFNFLSITDPYNAYYQQKVRDFREGKATEPVAPKVPQKVQEIVKAAEFIPKDPPAEFEFSADPATINAFDLDLIKLTAMFVARNGRQFLLQLMNRESRNYQFDFLKTQHSNFAYFTKLVEQYTKVMIPPKEIVNQLRDEVSEPKKILENVRYRVEWEKHQRKLKQRVEAEAEKERVAYAQIDWHDFVVVQTVDFAPHEHQNLPPPCTPRDVGARLLAQARLEASKAAVETVEMEVESDSDEEKNQDMEEEEAEDDVPKKPAGSEVIQPSPAAPQPDSVLIRKDYNPKNKPLEKPRAAEKWVISPLTGEKIPADKLAEHMRYNTVDSQYFADRERGKADMEKDEPVFAPGVDISSNIRDFAERRSDIFGVGEMGAEQTVIGLKIGEEEDGGGSSRTIWDGHAGSIDSTTRAAASTITIQQQIEEIHRAQGLTVDSEKERIGPVPTQPAPPLPPPSAPRAAPRPPPPSAPLPRPPPPDMPRPPAAAPPVRPVLVHPVQMVRVPIMTGPGFMAGAPPMPRPMIPAQMPQAPRMAAPPPPEEEPPSKRSRTEEQLIPEANFLQTHRGPVTVKVFVPNASDKPEWKLNGQVLDLTFQIEEVISGIKARIQDETNLPASKQKLVYDGMFIKDSNTLAFYNMENGASIQVQLKERGGRKR